jgi:hypothetical protein
MKTIFLFMASMIIIGCRSEQKASTPTKIKIQQHENYN